MAEASLVHGLGKDLVAPDWPQLQLQELDQVLAAFPEAGGAEELLWHSPRPLAAGALVASHGPVVFVKRHPRLVRGLPGLVLEHAFLDHLRARGVPTARALRTGEGAPGVVLGEHLYEAQLLLPGADLYRDAPSWTPFSCPGHARAAGAALGLLHRAAASFPAPDRPDQLLRSRAGVLAAPDLGAALAEQVARRPGLAAALAGRPWARELPELLAPLHRRLLPRLRRLGPAWATSSWAHNDWHASNLLWTAPGEGAEVVGVLDFGLSGRTSALYDLATALERNTVSWLDLPGPGIGHLEQALALLEGYRRARPLTPAEADALPELLALVHLDFALAELEYYAQLVGSPESVEVTYRAFLLGHARWFTAGEGAGFLAHVRAALAAPAGQ